MGQTHDYGMQVPDVHAGLLSSLFGEMLEATLYFKLI